MSDQNIVNNLRSLQDEKERLKNKIEISKKMIASNLRYDVVKNSAFDFLSPALSNFIIPQVSGLVFGKKKPGMHMFFSSVFPLILNSLVQIFNRKQPRK